MSSVLKIPNVQQLEREQHTFMEEMKYLGSSLQDHKNFNRSSVYHVRVDKARNQYITSSDPQQLCSILSLFLLNSSRQPSTLATWDTLRTYVYTIPIVIPQGYPEESVYFSEGEQDVATKTLFTSIVMQMKKNNNLDANIQFLEWYDSARNCMAIVLHNFLAKKINKSFLSWNYQFNSKDQNELKDWIGLVNFPIQYAGSQWTYIVANTTVEQPLAKKIVPTQNNFAFSAIPKNLKVFYPKNDVSHLRLRPDQNQTLLETREVQQKSGCCSQ